MKKSPCAKTPAFLTLTNPSAFSDLLSCLQIRLHSPCTRADPFATLALRPGWLVSRLGIAARTGLDAEVTAYSIVFWLHDALPAQDMIAWQEQKARITAEMALAGQKGAYGKLGALSSDLNGPLRTC